MCIHGTASTQSRESAYWNYSGFAYNQYNTCWRDVHQSNVFRRGICKSAWFTAINRCPPIAPPTTPPEAEPEPQEETTPSGSDPVKLLITDDLDVEIGDISLSDTKDCIEEVAVIYRPKRANVTKKWELKFAVHKDGIRESNADKAYSSKVTGIQSDSKISYNFNLAQVYTCYVWDPDFLNSGDYRLIIYVVNENTDETVYTLYKDFSLGESAPIVQ